MKTRIENCLASTVLYGLACSMLSESKDVMKIWKGNARARSHAFIALVFLIRASPTISKPGTGCVQLKENEKTSYSHMLYFK